MNALLAALVTINSGKVWAFLGAVVLAVIAMTPGVLAYRSGKRADKRAEETAKATTSVEDRKVDREEFDAALAEWRALYESVKTELAVEREARRNETHRADVAETEARTARIEVADLRTRVGALENELATARSEIARLTKETS